MEYDIMLEITQGKEIDLARRTGRPILYGADAGDRFGQHLTIGDLDGDGYGYGDWIGTSGLASGPGNARSLSGEAVVVYGGPDRLVDTDLSSPPPGSVWIYGADDNDRLGESVIGDFNGHNFPDIAIGSPGSHGPGNLRLNSGEVTILYGGPGRLTTIDLLSPPAASTIIYGADADSIGDHLTVLAVGNLDGDAYDDLVLSAERSRGAGNLHVDAGEIWVLYGEASPPGVIDLASPPGNSAIIFGPEAGGFFGRTGAVGEGVR